MPTRLKTNAGSYCPAEELQAFDTAVKDERKAELEDMLAHIKALANTPHTEDVAGTDATLTTKLSEIEEKSRDTEITSEGISSLTEEALTAGMAFLAEATPESVEQPFDITFLMSDAELTDGEGWSSKPTISFSCGEFFEKTFDFNQTVTGFRPELTNLKAEDSNAREPQQMCIKLLLPDKTM